MNEHSEMNMIVNVHELANEVGVFTENANDAELANRISNAIYKYTSSGVSVKIKENKVFVNCIVEGTDAEVNCKPFSFPFERQQFWDCVDYVDDEASRIWNESVYDGDSDSV